ncbi:hypothetical protein [Hathewaya massiliensis]|nr:hypothetical protein [Hathewaya massiliensis]
MEKVEEGIYAKKFDFSKNPSQMDNSPGKYMIRLNVGKNKCIEEYFQFK